MGRGAADRCTLGDVHRRMGGHEEALEHLSKALRIQRKALGEESLEVADVRLHTGLVYRSQGQAERARGLFEACAKTYARVYGPEHGMTQEALWLSREGGA